MPPNLTSVHNRIFYPSLRKYDWPSVKVGIYALSTKVSFGGGIYQQLDVRVEYHTVAFLILGTNAPAQKHVQAHSETVQAHLGIVQAHLGIVQAHFGIVQAHLGSVQVHFAIVQARGKTVQVHFVQVRVSP